MISECGLEVITIRRLREIMAEIRDNHIGKKMFRSLAETGQPTNRYDELVADAKRSKEIPTGVAVGHPVYSPAERREYVLRDGNGHANGNGHASRIAVPEEAPPPPPQSPAAQPAMPDLALLGEASISAEVKEAEDRCRRAEKDFHDAMVMFEDARRMIVEAAAEMKAANDQRAGLILRAAPTVMANTMLRAVEGLVRRADATEPAAST
jgi:hypothetical protein